MKKALGALPILLLPLALFGQAGKRLAVPASAATEVLQKQTLPTRYFKTVLQRSPDGDEPQVVGVNVYDKKTRKLLQQLKVEAESQGADGVEISDYNFDGRPEFSIFETGYAGPNTSRIYFLLDPKTGQFFESGFQGTSLTFNAKTKTVSERNQCCAGSQVTTADYRVVNNKMVLLRHHCFQWDEAKQKLVERKWATCE